MTAWARQHPLPLFFGLSLGLAWACWLPLIALGADERALAGGPPALLSLLGAFAPSISALLLTALADGRRGLRALLATLLRWRAPAWCYFFALLAPPALALAALALQVLLGGPTPDFADPPVRQLAPPDLAGLSLLALLLPVALQQLLLSSPMGEELGWRGFAQPRLQEGLSGLRAGLLLGGFWALWHLPRLWGQSEPPSRGGPLLVALLALVAGSVATTLLFSWLCNGARGSLLPPLLLHTSYNLAGLFLPRPAWPLDAPLAAVVALALVLVTGPDLLASRRASGAPAGSASYDLPRGTVV